MEYGLIGEHLPHSYSCEIHRNIGHYQYEILELPPQELSAFFARKAFKGINVTIPYKQAVIPFLDEISQEAREIGAVNTIVNRNGRLCGYNTDFSGMIALLQYAGISVKDKKALILGTGGTSKTAAAVVSSLGGQSVTFASRKKAANTVTYEEAKAHCCDVQIIINTTPVGMYPHTEESPIDISCFPKLESLVDAIYNPLRTKLVLAGQKRGIPATGGLYMLAAQAVYASALFFGNTVNENGIEDVFKRVKSEKENIVLIGMPSCGKSSVGKRLALQMNKTFLDTDEEITKKIGMSISDFFACKGESAFRALEKETIAKICASGNRQGGMVIATGGGAILSEENVENLKANSTLIFLERSPERLVATSDRPLSSSTAALMALYHQRLPLYRNAADLCIDGNDTIERTTQRILEVLTR